MATESSRIIKIFRWSFGLYVVALLTSIAAMEALAWLFVVAAVILVLKKRRGEWALGVEWPVGIFLSTVIFSIWVNGLGWSELFDAMGEHFWVFYLYGMVYLLRRVNPWPENLNPSARLFEGLVLVVGVYAYFQFFYGTELFRSRSVMENYPPYWRAVGFFNMPLTFAATLGAASFLPLSRVLLSDKGVRCRILSGTAFAAAAFSVVVSLTRGAWLAFFVSVVLVTALIRWKVALGFVTLAAALGLFIYNTNEVLRQRVNSISDKSTYSRQVRSMLWHSNWQMFLDHPLTGVGYGQNVERLGEYYEKLGYKEHTEYRGHSHNNYLHTLSGVGLVGALAFLWVNLFFLLRSFRFFRTAQGDLRWLSATLFGAQVYLQLAGLSECNFNDAEVNHMYVALWVLTSLLPHRGRPQKV